jgi:gamma-glutamyl-gamma-aminobutyrate hydrolase PuuD
LNSTVVREKFRSIEHRFRQMTSQNKKNVALTMRVTHPQDYPEPRDSISHDWIVRLSEWGLNPVLVPNRLPDPAGYLTAWGIDLIILTGGEDVATDSVRDQTECEILELALSNGIPVLGVCRGFQLINHYLGGRLDRVQNHAGTPHSVRYAGIWSKIYGEEAEVNSFHNQGISEAGLAPDLVAVCKDEDGMVEAAHHRQAPLFAMMWHPERGTFSAGDRRIVERLIDEKAFWH